MIYLDKTTNKKQNIDETCAITGACFNIDPHHFIRQQDCRNKKKWFLRNGLDINSMQKIIPLERNVHADLHAMSKERFYTKYGVNKDDYLFNVKDYNRK